MFDNIGGKIQAWARFCCGLGVTLSVSGFLVLLVAAATLEEPIFVLFAFLVGIVGSLVSWISSFTLYGFGRLVENSDRIASSLAPKRKAPPAKVEEPTAEEEAPAPAATADAPNTTQTNIDFGTWNTPSGNETGAPAKETNKTRQCCGCGAAIKTVICPYCGRSQQK